MRFWMRAACVAALAVVPGSVSAADHNGAYEPQASLTTYFATNSLVYFKARPIEDGSELSIACDGCKTVYRKRLEGLWPQGAFVLAHHPHGINLATVWQTPSRGALIVYDIDPTGIRIVLDATMNSLPTFTIDSKGREQVIVPGYVDVGREETHPHTVTVYTWDGARFVSREKPWTSVAGQ